MEKQYTDAEIEQGLKEFKELEKQGFYAEPAQPFSKGAPGLAVLVEVAIPGDLEVKPLQWNVRFKNKRGASVVLSDFKTYDDAIRGQRIVSFVASMALGAGYHRPVEKVEVVTSFRDFLWRHGHEELAAENFSDCETKPVIGIPLADIGWYLPCRFADRLTEALGDANAVLFSGVLEDSLLYGPMWND